MGTITSANAVYLLVIPGLFPVPQQLQGFATDAAFDTEASDNAEVVMGVDGVLSAGFVPFMTNQTIHIQADSDSIKLFEAWLQTEKALKEKLTASGVINLPSVNRSYIMTNGILKSIIPIPSAKKVLAARDFTITWGSIDPVPLG